MLEFLFLGKAFFLYERVRFSDMNKPLNKKTKVLVTQAGTRNGYLITYSLGKMGVPVYCADTITFSQTRLSRFCCKYSTYPSPHLDSDRYFQNINQFIEHQDIGLIFPAYDEMIFLSQHRERLIKPDILIAPTGAQVRLVHNKADLHKLCLQIGVETPPTIELVEKSDIEKALVHLSLPLVLKPERGGGGWGVSIVKTPDELSTTWKAFDREKHQNRLFAQKYIEGPLYGYGALCDQGEILASNCYETVRPHPVGTGTSTFRKGVVFDEIEAEADKFFRHLKWTGLCHCDFLRDQATGKFYLIDANPRFWGGTAQALASGINIPFLMYLLGTGQHDGMVFRRSGAGITSAWLWGDVLELLKRLLKENGKNRILREHFSSWGGTFFDDLRLDDFFPFLGYFIQKLIAMARADCSKGF